MQDPQEIRRQIVALLDEEFLPAFIRDVIRDVIMRENASTRWLQNVLSYLQEKHDLLKTS